MHNHNTKGCIMRIALVLALVASPALADVGVIVAVNDRTVTIEGDGDFSLRNAGKGFRPSPEIVAQAKEICPKAKLLSAIGTPDGRWRVNYLFLCP
jgi:hypothetical protein